MTRRIEETLSVDGQTAEVETTGRALFVSARGAFGAGTITVQFQLADGSFVTVDSGIVGTLAADGELFVPDFPTGLTVRLDLAGATAPTIAVILQA
jgi:hypothetical protein